MHDPVTAKIYMLWSLIKINVLSGDINMPLLRQLKSTVTTENDSANIESLKKYASKFH